MARKVFLSILGTSFYNSCSYVYGDFRSSETRFAQQATLEFIHAKDWSNDDIAIFPLTAKAFNENWNREERQKPGTKEFVPYKGLNNILGDMNLPFEVKQISIPDGKDEKEMWQIFKIIYDELKDGDELYIDLTHSFRYLPMLLLVLSNYAKFLKKTSVKSLTYGNFEARCTDTNEAPISDLLPIVALQDWTVAAANFINNGNVKELRKLSDSTLNPILRQTGNSDKEILNTRNLIKSIEKTVLDFQTCRGMNIIKATNMSAFREDLNKTRTTFIEPLNPIIDVIEASFKKFGTTYSIQNGFYAAKWCFDNGLYQQAVTIFEENVVSFFCDKYGILIDDEVKRESLVKKALQLLISTEVKAKINTIELSENDQHILGQLMKDELLQSLAKDYSSLRSTRNDINHNGMRSLEAPQPPERLILKIGKNMNSILEKIDNFSSQKKIKTKQSNYALLINLSNHPYEQWDITQKQAAQAFGTCVDLPFPAVDPAGDEQYITQLAEEYRRHVHQLAETSVAGSVTVHLMGEMTFTYALLQMLREDGVPCIASTTERMSTDLGNGQKEMRFVFVRFRNYFNI